MNMTVKCVCTDSVYRLFGLYVYVNCATDSGTLTWMISLFGFLKMQWSLACVTNAHCVIQQISHF